jgi:hypothetical protein
MRRALTAAGAAAVTAVAALAISTTTAVADDPVPSSAYAFSAEGGIEQEPTPFVQSTDGSTQSEDFVEIPADPLVNIGAGKVTAGDGAASVTMADIKVLARERLKERSEP